MTREWIRIESTDMRMSYLRRLMAMLVADGREVWLDGDRGAVMVRRGSE